MLFGASGLTRVLNGTPLFSNLSFALQAGERLAVTGASGSGKTSLLRTLAWLDPLGEGEVSLEGRNPKEIGVTRFRQQVCLVPQAAPLWRGTPADLLRTIDELKMQRDQGADDAIQVATGWGLPEDSWHRAFSSLSGGEQKRVLLAIALSRKPKVLLLDEPTAALDEATTERVEASLGNAAAVWVTHDRAQAARVAHRTLELG